ncbi:dihydrofolate reductase family protein [Arthrobacter sp. H5]|uniref:dihydrofolate reductase family protein n=1 Tax=Arthrobacter sp. H5 TaxID=1267973 RepID=UPI0004856C40|nr:dihydrofolate reductase family protein [Arthrobacter sp. H5]
MAKLIYSAIMSLDGYIEDRTGHFDWAQPDAEVHGFINNLERPVGIYLYGRRMYTMMVGWETDPALADQSTLMRDFAGIWQAASKTVYSRTLQEATTSNTRIEREFDAEAIRGLKTSAASDLAIGGPDLAAHAFRAGLVDECHIFLIPIVVGGGKPGLPPDSTLNLTLHEERRFAGGTVFLRYQVNPR